MSNKILLLTHGNENIAKGGPSVRVKALCKSLNRHGVCARFDYFRNDLEIEEDIVHVFNFWPFESSVNVLRSLKKGQKKIFFSPIYLDLSERSFWRDTLPYVSNNDPEEIKVHYHAFKNVEQKFKENYSHQVANQIRTLFHYIDGLIFLSAFEKRKIEEVLKEKINIRNHLMLNSVNQNFWKPIFNNSQTEKRYFVSVGRIEPRKNQLLSALAFKGLDTDLFLIGKPSGAFYFNKIRKINATNVKFLGHINNDSEEYKNIIGNAHGFISSSWAEGAPVSAIEACSMGVPLALTNLSSEYEYYADLAKYFKPWDVLGLRKIINDMAAQQRTEQSRVSFSNYAKSKFDVDFHAKEICSFYFS